MINIDALNDDEKLAALESIHKSIAESKEIQRKKITTNVELIVKALKKIEADLKQRYDETGNLIANLKSGEDGRDGRDGKDGKDGRAGKDGAIGPRGYDGVPGRNGLDGQDGVSITDAHIDFDGSLIISLSTGRVINVGEVVTADIAEKIKVITNGGGTSQYVLDTLASLQAQISGITSGLSYQGTWNANTNTPTLTSSVGTNGYYYIVSVAGSTNLNGVTDWQVGDWAVFNGTVWQKLDQTDIVTSVAGRTGAIVLTTADIGGLGTIATQAANNVAITGGSITGITDLAIADGGTGASTAANARTNLGLVIGTDVLSPTGSAASLTSFPTFNQNTTGTAANVTGTVAIANGGTGATTAATARTNLGATTVGASVFTLTNPSAITFPRFNADNSVSALDAATFRTAIGAGTSSTTGTVTSVSGTGTVNGLTLTGTVTTSGNLTLGGTLSGIANSALTNSSITIGGTAIALGGSSSALANDITIYGVTVGRGASGVSTNTAVGASALTANTTGSQSAYFGWRSGYSNTTGDNNAAFGDVSLYSNTTGSGNTAIGRATLYANTTASNNTAVGYQSLSSNTTGIQNIAVGTDALLSNQTGNYNTAAGVGSLRLSTASNNSAFGWVALNSNTSGANNVAVGTSALQSNTTASNNTAVGFQAAYTGVTALGVTAVGSTALKLNTGNYNTGVGLEALLLNTSGTNNTAVGTDALYSNTTASNNSAFGKDALLYNTTGASNVAIGASALSANTTASDNTAVGYRSGSSLTTGAGNVAIGVEAIYIGNVSNSVAVGYAALRSASGGENTALGYQALVSNTTASQNTALGYQSLYTNTTGARYTAVGYQALYASNNATGYATAVGWQALKAQTTGYSNTAIGDQSMQATTSGNSNVAVGSLALYSNTTASYNTAVGSFALASNTTASNNTAVGYQAGYTATQGSNTFIGYQAGYLSTGYFNTFVGTNECGAAMTTGYANTIIGKYSGNQGGLDIRTANNYIVLSDGDGNPRGIFDGSGNFLVGATSGSTHTIKKAVSVGSSILEVIGNNVGCVFYNGDGGTPNAANAPLKVWSVGATGRSINAAGTINASGADYAEYMTKAGSFTVAKGDVVGIDSQGKLTNVFADAVSFVVKSTNPSYVGNDTWGGDIEGDELEAARQTVDRIAFAGQVPVNVIGATAGQYIVPINDDGAIKGQAVSNPTFEQYQSSVGKVIAIEADGRARIIVKVA
jgi:hypothetical protein